MRKWKPKEAKPVRRWKVGTVTITKISEGVLKSGLETPSDEEGFLGQVNLGIGLPTLVANHLPHGREIFLHSENGILGMGPAAAEGSKDYDPINAGKQPVTLLPGGTYFHHADSFSLMRGGHLDICVLGAFQVSVTGDLANWHTGEKDAIPAVGGAMDLAIGARQTWVMMELLTKKGDSKVVAKCLFPLTAMGCVKRVYTDLATLACTPSFDPYLGPRDTQIPAGLRRH